MVSHTPKRPFATRRKQYRAAYDLYCAGDTSLIDVARKYGISATTMKNIVKANGDWPPIPANTTDLIPENPPPISIGYTTKPSRGMSMVIKRPLLYFNACPRSCGGTVEVTNDSASCLSCGWEYYGVPNSQLFTDTFHMVNGQRMKI